MIHERLRDRRTASSETATRQAVRWSSVAIAMVLPVLAASACAHSSAKHSTAPSPVSAAPGGADSQAGVQFASNHAPAILRPGDVVRLKIYREPDLSGDYQVNEAGIATFPKVGAVKASDITTDSLQHLLVSTYSQFLREPAIEVIPLRRITVLGSVKNPGLYPVDPTMTVADVIAQAGGPTPDGNQKNLQLIRGGQKQDVTITTQQQVTQTPIRSGDELFVPERSWLSRNGYVVGAVIGAATIITTTIITHR